VPAGFGAARDAGQPIQLPFYTDASQQQQTASLQQVVGNILGAINLAGRPPVVGLEQRTIQTTDLNFISYFVPSMLGLSIMQVGLFAAIPLVGDREKLILKRLAATPLRRWQLVGSNILVRLIISVFQAVIIIAVGTLVFGVEGAGSPLDIGAYVLLGSVTFSAIGNVLASFASTEDAANGLTSVVQFPLMFLSGVFFPIEQMPEFLQKVAYLLPLTYLVNALRQVMVDGIPLVPLGVCFVVLLGWLVGAFAISARFFRWQ
jgi:ABC-2 type transport system permease protein